MDPTVVCPKCWLKFNEPSAQAEGAVCFNCFELVHDHSWQLLEIHPNFFFIPMRKAIFAALSGEPQNKCTTTAHNVPEAAFLSLFASNPSLQTSKAKPYKVRRQVILASNAEINKLLKFQTLDTNFGVGGAKWSRHGEVGVVVPPMKLVHMVDLDRGGASMLSTIKPALTGPPR